MAELTIIEKEYLYLKIPTKYIYIYHRLMELMVDYGVDMLKDCKADCNSRNVEINKCFTMFNAALYARELSKTKVEETLIKYIKAVLKRFNDSDSHKYFTIKLEDGTIGYVDATQEIPVIYNNPIEPDPEPPVINEKILYGIVRPTDFNNYQDYENYSTRQIIEDNFIDIKEIYTNNLKSSYEYNFDESKLMFVILIPVNLNYNVKIDDGFGGKVNFGSTGLWYSNGENTVSINDTYYKVYGELYTISSNVKFYIF